MCRSWDDYLRLRVLCVRVALPGTQASVAEAMRAASRRERSCAFRVAALSKTGVGGPGASGARILLAPAATEWGSGAASENSMMFEVVSQLSGDGYQFVAVTELVRGSSPCPTVVVGRRRLQAVGGLTLPFRAAWAVWRGGLLSGVDLVHHGFPFAIGSTFSLLPLMLRRGEVPFVVGPVQTPQSEVGRDEGSIGFAEPPVLTWLNKAAARVAWGPVAYMFRSLSGATLRSASAVVAMTGAARDLVLEQAVRPERVRVIPPPIGAEFFHPHVEASDRGQRRVVTAGWLIERKGADDVLRAFAGIRRHGIDAQLVIAGDGPRRADLEAEASSLGIRDAVKFAGWLGQADLANLFASADAFVSMSRSESWGLTLGEAMACGTPVISADNTGAREQISDGENGFLVPIRDASACEARLIQVCQDSELRARLARRGRSWAEETVHPRPVSARWAELYQSVIAERGPRPGLDSLVSDR